jgi:hypothetical protein
MNTKLKVCATLLAASLTSAANAGVVTSWNYNNQAGFATWSGSTDNIYTADDVAATGNSATGDNSALSVNANNILDTNGDFIVDGNDDALHTSLTWGFPAQGAGNPQSSLNIDSPVTGALNTNDWTWADGTNLTHENWVIVGDSLKTGSLFDGLTLTPSTWTTDPGDPSPLVDAPYFSPQLQFDISFLESANGGTWNAMTNQFDCPDGGVRGVGSNINGCGDIFALTIPEIAQDFVVFGDDFLEFTVPFVMLTADGNPIPGWSETTYYVTTRLSGLTTLAPQQCGANNSQLCAGFVTVEQQSNELLAQFKVRTVPEPTAIALFGLGLIATGFAGRRKRNV